MAHLLCLLLKHTLRKTFCSLFPNENYTNRRNVSVATSSPTVGPSNSSSLKLMLECRLVAKTFEPFISSLKRSSQTLTALNRHLPGAVTDTHQIQSEHLSRLVYLWHNNKGSISIRQFYHVSWKLKKSTVNFNVWARSGVPRYQTMISKC